MNGLVLSLTMIFMILALVLFKQKVLPALGLSSNVNKGILCAMLIGGAILLHYALTSTAIVF